MTTSIVRLQENQALLSTIVESKLTRSEVLDLVVDRVRLDLNDEIDKLKAERQALKTDLSPAAALKLLSQFRDSNPSVSIGSGVDWNGHQTRRYLKLEVSLPIGVELPKSYIAANAKNDELTKQIRELEKKRSQLVNGKVRARVAMLKQALENTPEGQRISEAITALGVTLREKLTTKPALEG